jgi:hypothetical protein
MKRCRESAASPANDRAAGRAQICVDVAPCRFAISDDLRCLCALAVNVRAAAGHGRIDRFICVFPACGHTRSVDASDGCRPTDSWPQWFGGLLPYGGRIAGRSRDPRERPLFLAVIRRGRAAALPRPPRCANACRGRAADRGCGCGSSRGLGATTPRSAVSTGH